MKKFFFVKGGTVEIGTFEKIPVPVATWNHGSHFVPEKVEYVGENAYDAIHWAEVQGASRGIGVRGASAHGLTRAQAETMLRDILNAVGGDRQRYYRNDMVRAISEVFSPDAASGMRSYPGGPYLCTISEGIARREFRRKE